MKLTRHERESRERQMKTVDRGQTWVGCRPTVMQSKKNNIKAIRRYNKSVCKAY